MPFRIEHSLTALKDFSTTTEKRAYVESAAPQQSNRITPKQAAEGKTNSSGAMGFTWATPGVGPASLIPSQPRMFKGFVSVQVQIP